MYSEFEWLGIIRAAARQAFPLLFLAPSLFFLGGNCRATVVKAR